MFAIMENCKCIDCEKGECVLCVAMKKDNCNICGDYHEDNIPLSCETGDGEE